MLPPRVPRFWLAMLPVQEAAWTRSGKSAARTAWLADVGVGGSGADGDGVGGGGDEAEFAEVVDGEETLLREMAGSEGDHEFGASGDGG